MNPIRRAIPDDRAAVEAVVRRAFGPYAPLIGRLPAPMEDDYGRRIVEGAVDVLYGPRGIVGLAVLTRCRDAVLLHTLAVDPAAQGRGHGRRLLDHAVAVARTAGVATLRLHTNPVMLGPIAFYARAGFHETRRGDEDGFQRVWMERPLG